MDRDESPELIKERMTQTTQSLADKVSALETTVVGTLADAQATVQDTIKTVQDSVQTVKSAVEETATTVKQTVTQSVESVGSTIQNAVDLRSHVQANPWLALGGTALAGAIVGYFLFPGRTRNTGTFHNGSPFEASSVRPEPMLTDHPARKPGLFDEIMEQARQELSQLGKQAIQQLTTSAKNAIEQKIPQVVNQFADTVIVSSHRDSAHQTSNVG